MPQLSNLKKKTKKKNKEKQKKTLERVLVFQFPLALLPERPQTHNRGITFNAHEMASGNDGLYNQQERSTQYRYILTGLKSDRIYITKKLDVWRVCQMKNVRREGGIQLI